MNAQRRKLYLNKKKRIGENYINMTFSEFQHSELRLYNIRSTNQYRSKFYSKWLLIHASDKSREAEKAYLYGKVGILCSFLKKLSGSTIVFILTNLSKLSLKYFSPYLLPST